MIAAGYTLDLYCDCGGENCRFPTAENGYEDTGSGEYVGETYSECAKQARADGWYISRDRQRCIAPGHKAATTQQHEERKDG